jgi:hypothetical protein
MAIAFIIVILLSLGLGIYGGYRYGSFHIAKENETLRNQLILQERFSRTWAEEATEKYNLSHQIAREHTTNLGAHINMAIELLNRYQIQNTGNLNQQQNEKISDIINKAKSIATLHE